MKKVNFLTLVAIALFGISLSVRAEYEGIDAACRVTKESVRKLSHQDLFGKISQTWSCTETPANVKANDAPFRPLAVERVNLISEEIARRAKSGDFSKTSAGVRRSLNEAPETLQSLVADLVRRGTGAGAVSEQQLDSVTDAIVSLQKPAPKLAPKPAPVSSVPPATASTATVQDAGATCDAYGFFTLKPKNGVCQGVKKLPPEFKGSLLNPEQVICPKEGSYICNPLVFGFLLESQNGGKLGALCVESSAQYSVESCDRESEKLNAKPVIKKLIEGPRGEELRDGLDRSISSYCGSQTLQNKKVSSRARRLAAQDCNVFLRKPAEKIKSNSTPAKVRPMPLTHSGAQ